MKPILRIVLSAFVLISVILACEGLPTTSSDAVNTAIAQTQISQALAQATVNADMLTSVPLTQTAGVPLTAIALNTGEPTSESGIMYNIETTGYPSFGPADAQIVIVEFGDYQCPFCYRWHVEVYDNLLKAYPDNIRFVYRNFPLSFHQNAFASAEAALCAGDQNAYWKFHDVLFDSQNLLNNESGAVLKQEDFNNLASGLGLDSDVFEQCMTSHKYKQFVEDDIAYASSLPPDHENGQVVSAVGGTPTFFINGHRLGGAYPIEYFKEIIDSELAKQ